MKTKTSFLGLEKHDEEEFYDINLHSNNAEIIDLSFQNMNGEVDQLKESQGDLGALQTTEKSSLVGAMNEVKGTVDSMSNDLSAAQDKISNIQNYSGKLLTAVVDGTNANVTVEGNMVFTDGDKLDVKFTADVSAPVTVSFNNGTQFLLKDFEGNEADVSAEQIYTLVYKDDNVDFFFCAPKGGAIGDILKEFSATSTHSTSTASEKWVAYNDLRVPVRVQLDLSAVTSGSVSIEYNGVPTGSYISGTVDITQNGAKVEIITDSSFTGTLDCTVTYKVYNIFNRYLETYESITFANDDVELIPYEVDIITESLDSALTIGDFTAQTGSNVESTVVVSDQPLKINFEEGGYSLLNANYDSISFSVSAQDGNPIGIFFNPDGTKMYMLGYTTYTIYQYSLSTPWDLTTLSYDSVSFSVAGQDSALTEIFFKPDGTKMYIVGYQNDRVHQHTLSTPWDLSAASYNSISFSVASQDGKPHGIFFKPDGTKMYILGDQYNSIYQYTLSTPWDLTTLSYDSVSFSIGSRDGDPYGLFFKSDGTKMYMVGVASDFVYQHTLSTPWDLSTASYDSISFSVAGQDNTPHKIFFKPDGTKMYMIGASTDSVYQYSTTVPITGTAYLRIKNMKGVS